MISSTTRAFWLCIILTIVLSSGCQKRNSTAGEIPAPGGVDRRREFLLFRGELLENRQEGGHGVARYRGMFLIPCDDEVSIRTVTYYSSTLASPLPQQALLVVQDVSGALRVIGGDTEVGVFEDTEENASALIVAIQDGTMLPSEERWLPRGDAIQIALDAGGINRQSSNWRPRMPYVTSSVGRCSSNG
jgi:hypothetical protein